MTALTRIWFVSPVYRDAGPYLRLRDDLKAISARTEAVADFEPRFVVIDDSGGQDEPTAQLNELSDVEVLQPPFNLGHQRGIVHALRAISDRVGDDDLIVTLDADGEDQPEDLPRLLRPLLEHPERHFEISLALRTRRRDASPGFRLLYLLYKLAFRVLTGTSVRTGNFAAYRGRLARRMLLHPSFELSYASTLLALDFPIRFVPCERGRRYSGRSRMGYARLSIHALRMLMPFAERVARRAVLLLLSVLVLSLATILTVVAMSVFTDAAFPDWAIYALLGTAILSMVGLGNLVILFTVFSQSRAISLAKLEQAWDPIASRGELAPAASPDREALRE